MSTRGVNCGPPRVLSGVLDAGRSFWPIICLSAMAGFSWSGVFSRLDDDLARLGGLVLGELDEQHAVFELGLDLVGVHRGRQRQGADEAALAALLAVPDALLGHRRL